jgi:hypothetical protein
MKSLIVLFLLVTSACGQGVPWSSTVEIRKLVYNSDARPVMDDVRAAPVSSGSDTGFCDLRFNRGSDQEAETWVRRGEQQGSCLKPLGSIAELTLDFFGEDPTPHVVNLQWIQEGNN